MFEGNVLLAFALTTFAGLATGIGGFMVLIRKSLSKRFLSATLGFSAGVMIYVSFVEILPKAIEALVEARGEIAGTWMAVAAFFAGILVILIIDHAVPPYENPHEPRAVEETTGNRRDPRLLRMGMFTALAVFIHNFPEGLATFLATLADPALGVTIAIAIAIHNIPEGIAIAVPIFAATGSRLKAFQLSFLSGLAEPIGALIGYTILRPFFSPTVFGGMFAAVAGIMVYISLDKLLPTAREHATGHIAIYGVISGMIVMAVSLLLLI